MGLKDGLRACLCCGNGFAGDFGSYKLDIRVAGEGLLDALQTLVEVHRAQAADDNGDVALVPDALGESFSGLDAGRDVVRSDIAQDLAVRNGSVPCNNGNARRLGLGNVVNYARG